MPHRRLYYQHAVYHIIVRGNNRQNILKLKSDKLRFLSSIERYQERKGFKIYGFVIMDNHVHMVIEVSETHTISKVMQSILLSFSLKYRRAYDYVGHVWQGRFISKPLMDERYLKECLEYIHANPVKCGLAKKPVDYVYSSARFYEGVKNPEIALVLSKYGDTSSKTS